MNAKIYDFQCNRPAESCMYCWSCKMDEDTTSGQRAFSFDPGTIANFSVDKRKTHFFTRICQDQLLRF